MSKISPKIKEAKNKKRKALSFFPLFVIALFVAFSPIFGVESVNAISDIFKPWKWAEAAGGAALTLIAHLILALPAAILGIAGVLLNLAIDLTVVNMGSVLKGATGIDAAWSVLRDVSNIVFIFVLIWIGVSTILQLGNYKNLIPKLIIIALLVNFSLFITKFVIDISNVFSTEVLELIQSPECDFQSGGGCEETGISGAFMEEFGILSYFNFDVNSEGSSSNTEIAAEFGGNFLKALLVFIMGGIFMLIAAFIFFAATILLVIRFVVLVFLMVLSPLAFVAMILPQTASQAKKWWSALFSQAFFAPFFLLLVFVVLKILQSTDKLGAGNISTPEGEDGGVVDSTFAEALVNNDVSSMGIILQFFIVGGLLVAALILAKEMGVKGGSAMLQWGHSARKAAQGALGRNTVGRLSSRTSNLYNRMQSKIDNAEGTGGRVARGARRTASILSGGALSDKAVRETLEKGKQAKFGSKESFESIADKNRKRRKELFEIDKERRTKNTLERFKKGETSHQDVENATKRLSNKQLEEMGGGELSRPEMASSLKNSQFDYLMKSDELSQTEKDNIRAKREEGMIERISNEGVDSVIKGNNKDIAKLPANILTREDVAEKLNPSILNKLATEGELSQDQRNKIRQNIEDKATTPGRTPSKNVTESANWLTGQGGAIF